MRLSVGQRTEVALGHHEDGPVAQDRHGRSTTASSSCRAHSPLYNDMAMYTPMSAAEPNGKFQTIAATDQFLARQTATVLRYMFGKPLLMSDRSQNPLLLRVVNWGRGKREKTMRCRAPSVLFGGNKFDGHTGFSSSPRNPVDGNTVNRIGPFFDFKASRLVAGPTGVMMYADRVLELPYAFLAPSAQRRIGLSVQPRLSLLHTTVTRI